MTKEANFSIPLDPRDAAEICRILEPLLKKMQVRLLLFGSRARDDACPISDIDLALKADRPIPPWLLAEIREKLDESSLPFRVDLVDYHTVSPDLQRTIDQEGVP